MDTEYEPQKQEIADSFARENSFYKSTEYLLVIFQEGSIGVVIALTSGIMTC